MVKKKNIYGAIKKSEKPNGEKGEKMYKGKNCHYTKEEIQIANKNAKEFQLIIHHENKNW